MGRGDKKTAKGKRFKGSFGKTRPQIKKKVTVPQLLKFLKGKSTEEKKKIMYAYFEKKAYSKIYKIH